MPIDYSKYPKNWKTKIVPRILKRAKNKCESCGLDNYSTINSCMLYLRLPGNGRYGYRNIWIEKMSDVSRMRDLIYEVKTVKIILTIAHLDHDSENKNIKDDRLKAMCQKCHLDYDAEAKYNKKARLFYKKEKDEKNERS